MSRADWCTSSSIWSTGRGRRTRCNVEALMAVPSDSSFPSGHASSSFACAIALVWFVRRRRVRAGQLLLAAAIAASRAYVGVHYPFDVLAGALLGSLIGCLTILALILARRVRARRRLRPSL
ncbi:MAG: phosphatase PAP2 family protein [Gaiellaceae bacterium]